MNLLSKEIHDISGAQYREDKNFDSIKMSVLKQRMEETLV